MARVAIDYFEYLAGATPFIVLDGRLGRLPLQRVLVTAAGVVELHCKDGAIEMLGSQTAPVNLELIRRIREHHEGLLLVEVGQAGKPGTLKEHMLSSRFN